LRIIFVWNLTDREKFIKRLLEFKVNLRRIIIFPFFISVLIDRYFHDVAMLTDNLQEFIALVIENDYQ